MRLLAIFAAGLFAFPAAADSDLGHRLFTAEAVPACGICHTLAAAGTEGAVGPVLDEIKPDVARVRAAVSQGVGIMPAYDGLLTAEQIEAVATYVATATGAQ